MLKKANFAVYYKFTCYINEQHWNSFLFALKVTAKLAKYNELLVVYSQKQLKKQKNLKKKTILRNDKKNLLENWMHVVVVVVNSCKFIWLI